jgi:uncharacterized protein YaeQ
MKKRVAIKPKIYKLNINLSDLDHNYFDTISLTIALHPSETLERMMVRVMAFCINAADQMAFTKGLSATEEPDLWVRTLDGQISYCRTIIRFCGCHPTARGIPAATAGTLR